MNNREWGDLCVRRLLSHILILAMEDLGRSSQCNDAREFFASEQLDWIADALDLHPEVVRQRVGEGIDPKLLKYARRAHKGKNGGVLAKRALSLGY